MNNKLNSKNKWVHSLIILVSTFAFLFLIWLIYFNRNSSQSESSLIAFLPNLNAILNLITSYFLVLGYRSIRLNKVELHKKLMFLAFFTSVLFLISYVTYHHFHGDTKFVATGPIRIFYFTLLISHIVLSTVQLPLILTTLYYALDKQTEKHKKIAKITFPIWLYVSVTGVLIFLILKYLNQI